jgi:hypothetical protein
LAAWRHCHLTLERYELALEEQPAAAMRLRAQARSCRTCATALGQPGLASVLARWKAPGVVDRPVDWHTALRRATAPSSQRSRGRTIPGWRLPALGTLLVGLLLATALPAAGSAGADSKLFAVRGWEEDAHWSLTPEPDRAELDANLASAYLWQARMSAGHQDRAGYEASMARFFKWGAHLKTDIRMAPAAERSRTRASVATAMSLVSGLAASGSDPAEAQSARSLLDEVEGASQEGDGQHQDDPGPGGASPGPAQSGSAGPGGSSPQAGDQGGNASGGSGNGQDGP